MGQGSATGSHNKKVMYDTRAYVGRLTNIRMAYGVRLEPGAHANNRNQTEG